MFKTTSTRKVDKGSLFKVPGKERKGRTIGIKRKVKRCHIEPYKLR